MDIGTWAVSETKNLDLEKLVSDEEKLSISENAGNKASKRFDDGELCFER